jgi:hypothetical protein
MTDGQHLPRWYRRKLQKEHDKAMNFFGETLMGFYEFLEKHPKPSDQEVRDEFIRREKSWTHYCSANKLNNEAKLLFKKEVGAAWEKRYTKKEPTGKETRK